MGSVRRLTIAVLLLLGGLVGGGCTDDSGAEATAPLVDMLLDDEAVGSAFPELSARTDYSTGEDYGTVGEAEVAGGPAQEATQGVVRQWSADYSRSHDEPVEPAIVNVTSMVLEFPDAEAARGAAGDLLSNVEGEGGEVVPHDTFDAMVTPPDDDHAVTAVGVATVEEHLVTVQIDGIERIEAEALVAVLDAAAQRLR